MVVRKRNVSTMLAIVQAGVAVAEYGGEAPQKY